MGLDWLDEQCYVNGTIYQMKIQSCLTVAYGGQFLLLALAFEQQESKKHDNLFKWPYPIKHVGGIQTFKIHIYKSILNINSFYPGGGKYKREEILAISHPKNHIAK